MLQIGIALSGLVIGFLVGLTGMGGAALMTPFLILILGVKPLLAVGTDLAYSAVTKAFGAWQHLRQGTVDLGLSFYLAIGSLPGALLATRVLGQVQARFPEFIDSFVTRALGLVLVLVAVTIGLVSFTGGEKRRHKGNVLSLQGWKKVLTILGGSLVGFIVGLTSVGSGTLVVAMLALFYRLDSNRIVGTDVFHGALLVSFAGLLHLKAGNVNLPLVANLLLGSIPGVLLGAKLSSKVHEKVLRRVLVIVLLWLGLKLV